MPSLPMTKEEVEEGTVDGEWEAAHRRGALINASAMVAYKAPKNKWIQGLHVIPLSKGEGVHIIRFFEEHGWFCLVRTKDRPVAEVGWVSAEALTRDSQTPLVKTEDWAEAKKEREIAAEEREKHNFGIKDHVLAGLRGKSVQDYIDDQQATRSLGTRDFHSISERPVY